MSELADYDKAIEELNQAILRVREKYDLDVVLALIYKNIRSPDGSSQSMCGVARSGDPFAAKYLAQAYFNSDGRFGE